MPTGQWRGSTVHAWYLGAATVYFIFINCWPQMSLSFQNPCPPTQQHSTSGHSTADVCKTLYHTPSSSLPLRKVFLIRPALRSVQIPQYKGGHASWVPLWTSLTLKLIKLVDRAFTLLMQSQVGNPPKCYKNLSSARVVSCLQESLLQDGQCWWSLTCQCPFSELTHRIRAVWVLQLRHLTAVTEEIRLHNLILNYFPSGIFNTLRV